MSDTDLGATSTTSETTPALAAKTEEGPLASGLKDALQDPLSGGKGTPNGAPTGRSPSTGTPGKFTGGGGTELTKDGTGVGSEEQQAKEFSLALAKSTEYSFDLSVMVIPGFNLAVKASVETGSETKLDKNLFKTGDKAANTTSNMKLVLKIGGEFKALFFKIGLRLFGSVEVEVPGEKGIVDMAKIAAEEASRFFAADETKGVADRLGKVEGVVTKGQERLSELLLDLKVHIQSPDVSQEDAAKYVKNELKKDDGLFFDSLLTKLEKSNKSFEEDLASVCGLKGTDAAAAAGVILPFGEVEAGLGTVKGIVEAGAPKWRNEAATKVQNIQTSVDTKMKEAGKHASETVKRLDFAVPTPGVKVKGQLGAEVYAGFEWGFSAPGKADNKAEVSIGGGVQFDTGVTKEQVVKDGPQKGEKRQIFDKDAGVSAIIKAAGSISIAGWGGEFEATWAKGQGISAEVEAVTAPLPIYLKPGDISAALKASTDAIKMSTKSKDLQESKAASASDGKSWLLKTVEAAEGVYKALEPFIALISQGADMVDRGTNFGEDDKSKVLGLAQEEPAKVGSSQLLVGFSIEGMGSKGGVSGNLRVGTMRELEGSLKGSVAEVKAGKKEKETIKGKWE
jgi:hypothetical protein